MMDRVLAAIHHLVDGWLTRLRDVASLGVFIDCHDQDRFLLHEPSHTLYQNALTFVLTTTGVPIIYYGTEQGMTQSE